MKELWKPVKDFEGIYEVSNLGNVRSLDRVIITKNKGVKNIKGKVLSRNTPNSSGYLVVDLRGPYNKCEYIHRLVGTAFVSGYDEGKVINHIDGNKLNNNASNIEWVYQFENHAHSYEIGLSKIGEDSGNAKLKNSEVLEIFDLIDDSNLTNQEIGDIFNVTRTCIYDIRVGKVWTHLRDCHSEKTKKEAEERAEAGTLKRKK